MGIGFRVVVEVPPLTLDLGKGVSLTLAYIPAGKFIMGSREDEPNYSPCEGPRHEVTLSRPFYMGIYKVTQGQYETVMERNPSQSKNSITPVDTVSSLDVEEFCRRVSERSGWRIRLPSEAEWEYACRAGTDTTWFYGNTDANEGDYVHPPWGASIVGNKKPNPWGLFDMYGIISEWCEDCVTLEEAAKGYSAGPAVDPRKNVRTAETIYRVCRGGSTAGGSGSRRSAMRWYFGADAALGVGFRVVAEVPRSAATMPSMPATPSSASPPSRPAAPAPGGERSSP